jgi:transcriptional regulator with XRE-family HTH domain
MDITTYSHAFGGLQNLIMYGDNLKKLRYELRLSAQKLADATEVSLITMQNYELGKREPKYSFLYKLLTVYNVNINWLMTGEGEMFNATQSEPPEDIKQLVSDLIDAKLKARGLY